MVLYFFILIEIFENSAIFSISILLFIALKSWNFQDNLNFKGNIGGFISHKKSLSLNIKQYDKKKETKNKKINYGAIQTLSLCY